MQPEHPLSFSLSLVALAMVDKFVTELPGLEHKETFQVTAFVHSFLVHLMPPP